MHRPQLRSEERRIPLKLHPAERSSPIPRLAPMFLHPLLDFPPLVERHTGPDVYRSGKARRVANAPAHRPTDAKQFHQVGYAQVFTHEIDNSAAVPDVKPGAIQSCVGAVVCWCGHVSGFVFAFCLVSIIALPGWVLHKTLCGSRNGIEACTGLGGI